MTICLTRSHLRKGLHHPVGGRKIGKADYFSLPTRPIVWYRHDCSIYRADRTSVNVNAHFSPMTLN
jgi:hypothetical protein